MHEIDELTVLDDNQQQVRLGELWNERPAVLVFVRHFGWIFCQEQAVQLHRERHRLAELGADLVIIGNGTANFIAGFRERSGYQGAIYTDPERAAYKALGLRRGVRSTFSPGAVKNAVKAYRQGFRQIGTQGDALQQGGVFVVAPSGEALYSYRSRRPGDHPSIDDIVAALGTVGDPSN